MRSYAKAPSAIARATSPSFSSFGTAPMWTTGVPTTAWGGLAAIALARRNRLVSQWTQAEIRKSMMFLLLGTMLYTSLLCLTAARHAEALAVLAAVLPARWIARRISLT